MAKFTDNAGREWVIESNVTAFKRVKSLAGVDLCDAVGGDILQRLASETILLCDVLFAICKPQADERHVTDEDFGRALGGDSLASASSALIEAVVDFSPRHQSREALRLVLAKSGAAAEILETRMMAKATALTPEQIADSALASAGPSSGDAPG